VSQMVKRRWTSNLHRVEIEITTLCNLRCVNCDRSVRQAPSGERMTVEQIDRFVDESLEQTWAWERITLLGGEPTLHPELDAVLRSLDRYRTSHPDTIFRMYSNGFGTRVRRRLATMPPWFEVINTNKTRATPLFSAYNLAPVDLPEYAHEDFTKGCAITAWCGLGLTRYGFYPCGAGASIDRVFGLDLGIKRLADVTPARLIEQLRQLCGLCGHFRDFDLRAEQVAGGDKGPVRGWTREEQMSPTWVTAYRRYAEEKPQLSLY
jgi:hypothetical protein